MDWLIVILLSGIAGELVYLHARIIDSLEGIRYTLNEILQKK